MTAPASVKTPARIVGVIASRADLSLALQLRRPPYFFELRLDRLVDLADEVERAVPKLKAPLIITARHPREGGANNLSLQKRRALLLRFLPRARYVDLELRSVRALKNIVDLVRARKIGLIISFHDFKTTRSVSTLREKARAAQKFGADIFKVATRTDNAVQLQRLLDFQKMSILPTAMMGIGKLGRESRRQFFGRSVLNYAHPGKTKLPGQPSLSEIRRWRSRA